MLQKKLKLILFTPVLILFLSFLLNKKENFEEDQLVVWNMGQGQMVTYVSDKYCHHFDMGGERFPEKKIFKLCRYRKNRVYYTHWDQDHINFSDKAKRIFPSLCRVVLPQQSLPKSFKKRRKIQRVPPCRVQNHHSIKELHWLGKVQPENSNESSRVFVVKNRVLIPGDSNHRMEKYWSPLIKDPIQVLIAGHHGSASSTSNKLLNNLPHLNLAVASARKKRYKHPHFQTIRRLSKKGVPLLSTEDFNHIRISLGKGKLRVRSL